MSASRARAALTTGAALAVALTACSDSTAPRTAPAIASCSSASLLQLSAGQHSVVDPSSSAGCIRLPAAGSAGAEHLVFALSGTGQVTQNGLTAPYQLAGQGAGLAASLGRLMSRSAQTRGLSPAQQFHDMLRARGRELARQGGAALDLSRRPSLALAPTLGSKRSFQVCGKSDCSSFVTVSATLENIGPHGLLYQDDAAPSGGYSASDLSHLGNLFDNFMYPIDTTSFGRETDLDGNGAVIILLSPAVNHLSANCNRTGSVILGFFFPDDLVPGSPGSNDAEIFYGLVPDPNNRTCTIDRRFALQNIGPTFLHEFQHMISFGRHVVLAGGQPEDNWLDEGLSRLAEELGGREIPDSLCSPNTCSASFPFGDLQNAFEYLQKDTLEMSPLIEPGNIDGTLPDNGANWLFVRWLADHFASDTILGTSLTRRLDGADSPTGTGLTGSDNVSAVTQTDFPSLIGEWQLANFLTSVAGFTEPTGRLRYKSWNLVAAFSAAFGTDYPLQPDSLSSQAYSHVGVLKPGSGRHLQVIQAPMSPEVDVQLTSPTGGGAVSSTMVPRIAVARVR